MPWSFSSFRSYSPESRMREIRQSGLEGGGAGEPALPTPISHQKPYMPEGFTEQNWSWRPLGTHGQTRGRNSVAGDRTLDVTYVLPRSYGH